MNTKLTLKLDKNIIKKAKVYANKHNQSLSQIVEKYFNTLVEDKDDKIYLSPIVKELSGVLKSDASIDHKETYSDYLINKYK